MIESGTTPDAPGAITPRLFCQGLMILFVPFVCLICLFGAIVSQKWLQTSQPEAIEKAERLKASEAHLASSTVHYQAGHWVLSDAHGRVFSCMRGAVSVTEAHAPADAHYANLLEEANRALSAEDEALAFLALQEVFDAGAVLRDAWVAGHIDVAEGHLERSEFVPVFTRLLAIAERDQGKNQSFGRPTWLELRQFAYALTGKWLGPEPPKAPAGSD